MKQTKSRLKFPRIAIKLRPGQVTVRETETVLDEKIVQRTEEVSDPITGEPTLQTFEYVETTIEKEVRLSSFASKRQEKENLHFLIELASCVNSAL